LYTKDLGGVMMSLKPSKGYVFVLFLLLWGFLVGGCASSGNSSAKQSSGGSGLKYSDKKSGISMDLPAGWLSFSEATQQHFLDRFNQGGLSQARFLMGVSKYPIGTSDKINALVYVMDLGGDSYKDIGGLNLIEAMIPEFDSLSTKSGQPFLLDLEKDFLFGHKVEQQQGYQLLYLLNYSIRTSSETLLLIGSVYSSKVDSILIQDIINSIQIEGGVSEKDQYNRHLMLASEAIDHEEYEASLPEIQKAIDLKPESSRAWELYSTYYFMQGDWVNAEKITKKITEMDPLNPIQKLNLVELYIMNQKPTQAHDLLAKLLGKFGQTELSFIIGYLGTVNSILYNTDNPKIWQDVFHKGLLENNVPGWYTSSFMGWMESQSFDEEKKKKVRELDQQLRMKLSIDE